MKKKHSKLMGIKVFDDSYENAVEYSLKTRGYSCFVNSHMLYEHAYNKGFKGVLEKSSFNFTDGMPLVYAFRLFNGKSQARIAGNDFIFSLFDKAKELGLKVLIFGGSERTLEKMSVELTARRIKHKTYSPPFLPIEEFDFDRQLKIIKDYNPDLILVGLGCPKQEVWMCRMSEFIDTPMYGLGGAFLLYAGIDKRAPKWMRDLSLEWLFRFLLEPRRLFKRYLITNTYFCYLILREIANRSLRLIK